MTLTGHEGTSVSCQITKMIALFGTDVLNIPLGMGYGRDV